MHILKKRIIIREHRAILDLGALNSSKPFVSRLNGKHSQEDTIDSARFLFKRKSTVGFHPHETSNCLITY